MIIEIRSHGGFGGITAATSRRIDTDAQPEPRAQELCAAFHPKALANMAATPRAQARKAVPSGPVA